MGTKHRSPARDEAFPRSPSWLDGLVTRLIVAAATLAPRSSAARLNEEWRAHASELPAATSRLKFSLGCYCAALLISRQDHGAPNVASPCATGELLMAAYAQRSIPLFSREMPADVVNVVCEINTTPLIDIMLVLLIALIIALPLMTHGVMIELPHGPPPIAMSEPEVIDLDIQFDGTVFWNGTAVHDRRQLEDYFRDASTKNPQPEIRLRPSPNVRYDYVAQVLAVAQRNRMQKIGFQNTARFRD